MLEYAVVALRHKWYVAQACRKLCVPAHLAIMHDMSKFYPIEYALYQYEFFESQPKGRRSLPTSSRAYYAFRMHCKRNKHHWQYWVTDWEKQEASLMPMVYVREMIADWMGASKAYAGTWDFSPWFEKHAHEMILHLLTRHYLYGRLMDLGYWIYDPVNFDVAVVDSLPHRLTVGQRQHIRIKAKRDNHRLAGNRILIGKIEELE